MGSHGEGTRTSRRTLAGRTVAFEDPARASHRASSAPAEPGIRHPIDRRSFLLGALALGAAPLVWAQAPGRVYRVAMVLTTSPIDEMAGPDPVHPLTRAILHELRSLGYVEGGNLVFERRSAEGDPGRYRAILEELIGRKSDVIILSANRDLMRAAQTATRTVPIVTMGYPTAVEDGFVKSLARPGGNITGRALLPSLDVYAKSLELLKETVSRLSRVAVLIARDVPGAYLRVAEDAARRLDLELVRIDHHPTDARRSIEEIARARVDALLVVGSSTTYSQRERLGPLTREARLPGIFPYARIVETGGLMSYSANEVKAMRSVVSYVDRILKGADPGELPMESAMVFELVVNRGTANALGLTIPPSILLRADKVIE